MTYAKWGDSLYKYNNVNRLWGDGGAPATDPVLYWSVEVDWFNTGAYTGENEAKYCIDMETSQGRPNRLNIDDNGNADGIKMPLVGKARIVLDNTLARFDPYNAAGALYGKLLPGRYIRIKVTYKGTTYPVFHGNIIKLTAQKGANPTVTLDCEDGLRWIQGADTNVALSTSVFARNAVWQILNDIGFPTRFGTSANTTPLVNTGDLSGTQIAADETNGTSFVIPYFSANGSAKERIQELCNMYVGNFWVNESGAVQLFHFAKYFEGAADVSESVTLKDVNVPNPWENIISVRRTYYYPRARQATGTIWQYNDNVSSIAASASIDIWAEYTYNNEACDALGVIAPAATTDYTMFTNSDGTGTDLTGSFTVVQTDYGNKSKLVVTNNSASAGYITLLKIRGDAIIQNNSSYWMEESAPTLATYGRRVLSLASPYCQTYKNALGASNYTFGLNSREQLLECTMEGRPDIQFNFPLFAATSAYFPTFGYNVGAFGRTVIVGSKTHKWLANNGQAVRTTLILEDRT
jgi:hypothetical protein